MKRFALLLALILCASVFVSCKADEPADTTAADTMENVEDTELVTNEEVTSDTVDENDVEIDPSVQKLLDDDRYFIRLDWYLNILSSYIHEPYEKGDRLDNEYLPYMVVQCCALNRNICDAEFDEEIGAITISKSELLRVGNMLLGQDIPADDIDEYFSAPYATDFFYGDRRYYCDNTFMKIISDTDEFIIIETDLVFAEDTITPTSTVRAEYKLGKVNYNGIIIYCLEYIRF